MLFHIGFVKNTRDAADRRSHVTRPAPARHKTPKAATVLSERPKLRND